MLKKESTSTGDFGVIARVLTLNVCEASLQMRAKRLTAFREVELAWADNLTTLTPSDQWNTVEVAQLLPLRSLSCQYSWKCVFVADLT
ncbi:hypothetical protein TcWFU_002106 [Taenia crassiceps]|uniref:Uncharacterized protein n=1 Tax=Taenia crassiceps TaxID=6207 RepID=A0ABR4QPN8_9CEST